MKTLTPNFSRIQYLSDTLRQRFTGYIDESDEPRRSSSIAEGLPDYDRFEDAIRALLANSIPKHPAYNTQILFALKTFRANNIAVVDAQSGTARVQRILARVHEKRPRFALGRDEINDAVLTLHKHLGDYSKISGGDLHALPSIETLGQRRDITRLEQYDPGPSFEKKRKRINLRYAWENLKYQGIDVQSMAAHHLDGNTNTAADTFVPSNVWVDAPRQSTDKLELRKQQLKNINDCLDKMCPQGSYFNRIRQELIHQVWSNRHGIDGYRQGRAYSDQRRSFNDAANTCWHVLRNGAKNLENATPPPKIIPVEDAIQIDRLVRTHQTLTQKKKTATRGPLSDHVPEAIQRAVTRPGIGTRTNPVARQWAEKCADTVNEIIPYEDRNTLTKRIALQKAVFANRTAFVGNGPDERGALDFQVSHHNLLKTKPDLLNQLARELDNFDQAWTGKLRTPPERRAPEPAVLPVGKLRKAPTAFQTKGLISAAAAPGQQKLSFKHARSQGAIGQGAVGGDTAMSGTEPAAGNVATQSRKRKREDGQQREEKASLASHIASASTAGSGDEHRAKRVRSGRDSDRNERSHVR